MTAKEKIEKYDLIVKELWNCAREGNLLQSTLAATLIRTFELEGPEGEDPGEV
jgi:hypothetical protein